MKYAWKTLMLPLLSPEDAGAGSGGSGDAGGSAAGTADNGQAAGAAGSEGVARTGAAPTGFTYKEDRTDWMPKHRFNEVNTRAQQSGQRVSQLEADLAERDRKIAALAGVAPVDPNAQKADSVKAAFFQMFPNFKHLADLTPDQMQAILRAPQGADRAQQAEDRHWQQQGKTVLKTIYSEVAASFGAEKLSADQESDIQSSFAPWFNAKCRAELEASGGETSATLQKYEDNDPSLIADFVKRVTNNWVEPARRRVTQQTLTRTRPVPSSAGRTQITSRPAPENFKTLDERIEYGAGMLKDQGFFGGR